jgi:glycine/D-amino acid oxidase-like deaminating enzyme/nitrite reductase/ring-hydroxylating ferredoxin subunit
MVTPEVTPEVTSTRTSLWLDRPLAPVDDPFPAGDSFDDLVVGAGLTGLTVALLLARAGRHVGVVEARHHGAVTSGRTTAKVSVLQGTRLSGILTAATGDHARAYVEGNLEGQAWLRRFCDDHGVALQPRDSVVYAASSSEVRSIREEYDAARSLDLPVRWEEDLGLPFPTRGAVVLADQFQLDPMHLLDTLAGELHGHGGTLHEGHRVTGVSLVGRPTVQLDDGRSLTAENVVLATGMPILDRAAVWSRAEPRRSYLLAYRGVAAPRGMYLSAGSSARSVRDVPTRGSDVFLVGGSGHTTGRTRSEEAHLDELRAWTQQYFAGAEETHAWSAQDYAPYDGLPMIGRLALGWGRIFYATGYDKWGMTNAVAASLHIAKHVLGGEVPDWGRLLEQRLPRPRGLARIALLNAGVGAAEVASTTRAGLAPLPADVEEGTGVVGRSGGLPTGLAKVGGRTCSVLAVCTHVGGTLTWNDAEKSWDCPLHGSRFTPDGEVLEGPATRPLHPRGR